MCVNDNTSMPRRKGFVSPKVIVPFQQLQYSWPAALGKFEGCVRYALSVATLKAKAVFSLTGLSTSVDGGNVNPYTT
jgi:hypothetical protein